PRVSFLNLLYASVTMACTCSLRGATGLTLADVAFEALAACATPGPKTNNGAIPASSASRIRICLCFMLSLLADLDCPVQSLVPKLYLAENWKSTSSPVVPSLLVRFPHITSTPTMTLSAG